MKEKIKLFLKIIFIFSIVATMGMFWYDQINYYLYYPDDYHKTDCRSSDNVALIKIQGDIVTYGDFYDEGEDSYYIVSSEKTVRHIENADKRSHIKAIIIEIDSYGGYPVASEEIMKAVKRTTKPTIAVIREGGVSGAYLIATGANRIYASKFSEVGSIGTTMSYLDYSQKNKQEGLIYQQLSSGKFKDTGDPDKELTVEEKELLMKDIEKMHQLFVEEVAINRNLDIKTVEKLADGSTMLGEAAKENGLIDEIGDIYDAQDWLAKELNIQPEICVY